MTRDDYLTDLVSFCARPIGGATRMGVILNYIEKDFMDFPIDMVFDKERVPKINKNIRRHAKYSELFYEISEIEEEKGQTNGAPHQLALFDTVNDSMLIITNYSSEKLPMQIVPLNNHIKQRIYANYGLNFFPDSPCNTLADLMDKAPHDDEILSHSDDYPAKNDHQRERIKWLYDYKDKMFETKARNVTSSFSVPIFANPSLLCVSRGSRNSKSSHGMVIYDLANMHKVDIRTDCSPNFMNECHEYSVKETRLFIDPLQQNDVITSCVKSEKPSKRHTVNDLFGEFIMARNALGLIQSRQRSCNDKPGAVLDFGNLNLAKPDALKTIHPAALLLQRPQ